MPDNYVEILVKSRDEAAPDLDLLKAKLDELSAKTATARATVDDAAAAATLDRLNAKLIDLGHRTANPKISMSGAVRAEAEIHAIEASLDNLALKGAATDAELGGGGGLTGILSGLQGMGSDIPIIGTLIESPEMILPLVATIATVGTAIVTELGGLATGAVAAGLGLGSFAALALPTLDKIKTSYTAIHTAQQNYNQAVAKAALAPTKTNETAVKNAEIMLQLAQKQAGASAGAVAGIDNLTAAFGKMAAAIQPQVMGVFNEGLKIANALLPYLGQFAQAAAPAIQQVMDGLEKAVSGPGFKSFMSFLESLAGPVIKAVAAGIGEVAVRIGNLMKSFSKQDVLNAVTTAFHILDGVIVVLTVAIKGGMAAWDTFKVTIGAVENAIGHLLSAITIIGLAIGSTFVATLHAAENAIGDLLSWITRVWTVGVQAFDNFENGVQNVVDNVITWFEQLPGKIVSALASLGGDMLTIGRNIIQGIINGLEGAVGGLISKAKSIASDISGAFSSVLHMLSPSKVFADHGKNIVLGLVQGLDEYGPRATAAMQKLARTGLPGGVAASGAAGGAGGVTVEIGSTGNRNFDAFMLQWLRQNVRIKGGGSVQAAFGKAGM